MTLPEFLLACIADDEAIAHEVRAERVEIRHDRSPSADSWAEFDSSEPHVAVGHDRVLAECEAKRGIVREWMDVHGPAEDGFDCNCDPAKSDDRNLHEWHYGHADGVSKALRLLAVPYADRPGYRDEWRP